MLVFQIKKIMYDIAKEINFDVKGVGRKSTRDSTLIKLFISPAIMASGISIIIILSSDPTELCNRLGLLLQEKQAVKNSDVIGDEIVAIVHKPLENKCISKKKHKQLLIMNVIYYTKDYNQSYFFTS